jgi:hypothetical protein
VPTSTDILLHRLVTADAIERSAIVERVGASLEVTEVVAAALFAPDPNVLLDRAADLAVTTRDRQVVSIARALAAGDADLVDALARDHLIDHPDGVLVAWMSAESRNPHTHPRGTDMHAVAATDPTTTHRAPPRRRLRPWGRWLLTALAFPPSGLISHAIVGHVDAVRSALLGGLIAGSGIGAVQWALLRRRGVGAAWIAATAAGLAAGLAAGAAAVSYRTDITSLVLMGAISGVAVGAAQGAMVGNLRRAASWSLATGALWALGWTLTTAVGVDVAEQWTVFGAAGAVTFAALQSTVIRMLVPDEAVPS